MFTDNATLDADVRNLQAGPKRSTLARVELAEQLLVSELAFAAHRSRRKQGSNVLPRTFKPRRNTSPQAPRRRAHIGGNVPRGSTDSHGYQEAPTGLA
jgi:hypothetical protein